MSEELGWAHEREETYEQRYGGEGDGAADGNGKPLSSFSTKSPVSNLPSAHPPPQENQEEGAQVRPLPVLTLAFAPTPVSECSIIMGITYNAIIYPSLFVMGLGNQFNFGLSVQTR
ncbi:hypothetical protein P691DRAFT_30054 [Macrolepiota fuliginosa MF-IS2]|uniref:Uncharacterized protein n=1 Tax=Macrolepiota fuliginosa MF-IS2 TaxID=1400762 RepID=A0A9P5WYA5_9AGAR|nr:hypothetical protein P691DRAFT_30054 [Macrolepiota fuliginosa MF-IS2]